MRAAACLTAALLCICAIPASAGSQDGAVVAVHCPGVFIKGDACQYGAVPCSLLEVWQEPFTVEYVFLLVARADSIAGVSSVTCGVRTENLGVAWWLCADVESPSGTWPNGGSGNHISWEPQSNCQREVLGADGVHALLGVFEVFAYGDAHLDITPNEAEGETAIVVTDCAGTTSELTTPGGRVGFGNVEGYNPCADDVPVTPKTWGRIKQHYTD